MLFKNLTRRDISILIGNTLDHFDTSLYSFLAPIMAEKFFPDHEPVVKLILAYSILATSMITRPIGAFVFGNIARSHGALMALSHSLIGVAVTTFLIGCVPDYSTVGSLAPLALILIRIVRGIFAAGESTIAKLYILEGKTTEKAMKSSYLYQSSTVLGIVLASAISTIIITTKSSDAWRIGFWLGGVTAYFGYKLRKYKKTENMELKQALSNYTIDGICSIWKHKLDVIKVAAVTSLSHLTYSIPFVVMNSFVPLISDITLESMMALNTGLLVFDMLLIPTLGHLIRKIDPHKIMFYSSLMLLLGIIPLWIFIEGASLWYVTFIRFWIVCLGVAFLCPQNVWLNQAFRCKDRYLLTGMGLALGAATTGRLTPSICLALWHYTGSSISISIYVAVLSLITLIALKQK